MDSLDTLLPPRPPSDLCKAPKSGAFAAAGGNVLFGTDICYIQASDTSEEYQLMQGAGLSFEQILASLTTTPAARFSVESKGRIEVGMDADPRKDAA